MAKYNYEYTNIGSSYIGSDELIPLGMSVVRKLFVFDEIGPSTLGFIKGGLGYRFK